MDGITSYPIGEGGREEICGRVWVKEGGCTWPCKGSSRVSLVSKPIVGKLQNQRNGAKRTMHSRTRKPIVPVDPHHVPTRYVLSSPVAEHVARSQGVSNPAYVVRGWEATQAYQIRGYFIALNHPSQCVIKCHSLRESTRSSGQSKGLIDWRRRDSSIRSPTQVLAFDPKGVSIRLRRRCFKNFDVASSKYFKFRVNRETCLV